MHMRWLFLRGLVREARHWGDFPARFSQALGADPPLLLDLPGMGTEAGKKVPPSIAGFVDALRPRLLAAREEHPEARFGLFAVSLGGMVSLDWLSRFPGDFERAVIVNTSAGDLSSPFERFHPRNYPSIVKAVWFSGAAREREILRFTSNRTDERLDELAARHAEYAAERPSGVGVLVRQLWSAAKSRTPERVPAPTLFLASKADRLVDWSCSERIATRLSQPLVLHDSAGHDLPLDDPAWVIEQVSSWMETDARAA